MRPLNIHEKKLFLNSNVSRTTAEPFQGTALLKYVVTQQEERKLHKVKDLALNIKCSVCTKHQQESWIACGNSSLFAHETERHIMYIPQALVYNVQPSSKSNHCHNWLNAIGL